jgi:hypothetical protein
MNRNNEGLYSSSVVKDTAISGNHDFSSSHVQTSRDCQPKLEIPTNTSKSINNKEP